MNHLLYHCSGKFVSTSKIDFKLKIQIQAIQYICQLELNFLTFDRQFNIEDQI